MAKFSGQMPSRLPRKIREGKVVSSTRIVWSLSEDDIIVAARERGVLLTVEQLDMISHYVDKHFSPNGEWLEVIGSGLNSSGIPDVED